MSLTDQLATGSVVRGDLEDGRTSPGTVTTGATHAAGTPDGPEPRPLEHLVPGADLALGLAALEVADLDGDELIEAVAGYERVIAWATARQAEVVAELQTRREAERCARWLPDELALRLGTTRRSGETLVGLALGLRRLPAVHDALVAGRIDSRKARVFVDETVGRPEGVGAWASETVLRDAPGATAPQIRARLRRLEIDGDPEGAERRRRRARAARHVEMTPTDDSMAWISALLPAEDAAAVWTTLTALADVAPADDVRGVDARRADALVDLATRYLDSGVCPDGPLPVRQGRRPHLQVTASMGTVLGLDDRAGELAGYGPVPASVVRRIAARATWEPLLVSHRTGVFLARGSRTYRPDAVQRATVVDRDRTCVFPGCRVRAERCDVDHVRPFDPDRPGADQTTMQNLHALCRHHHLAKTHGRWLVRRTVDGRTLWTSPTGHTYERPPEPVEPPRPTGLPTTEAEDEDEDERPGPDGPGDPPPF